MGMLNLYLCNVKFQSSWKGTKYKLKNVNLTLVNL